MYKISEFAAVCGTTTKTIRFYDSAGVLEADYIDPSNGYRYYKEDKVQQYYKIISLKQIGFTIEEIKTQFLNADDSTVLAVLKEKENKLLQAYQNCKEIISIYEDKIIMLNDSQINKVHITSNSNIVELSCGLTKTKIICAIEDVAVCKNALNDIFSEGIVQVSFEDIVKFAESNKPVEVKHGCAGGENRGIKAAKQVLPSDREANAMIIMKISKGASLSEIDSVCMEISNNLYADAAIIWGVSLTEKIDSYIEITVVYFPL